MTSPTAPPPRHAKADVIPPCHGSKAAVITAFAFALALPATPLSAAPFRAMEMDGVAGPVVPVQARGGPWPCRGLYGPRRAQCEAQRRNQKQDDKKLGEAIALGVLGLAVGAMIAGAAQDAEQKQQAQIANRNAWIARCSARYSSFDPGSGTIVGGDGRRYPCR